MAMAMATTQVYLHDWWLIKAQGKGLAVGGFASRETQGVRVFCSAPISIRHNATTLKTIDGITITVSGFINRSRTHQNGFPYEVCNHFLFGFPYYWEEYATRCFGEESCNGCVPRRLSAFDELNVSLGSKKQSFLPVSLDDLSMTKIRDILMSTSGDSGKCVFSKRTSNDLLGKYSDKAFQCTGASIHSKNDTDNPIAAVDSVLDETPSIHKRTEVKKCKDKIGISNATDTSAEEFQNIICQSKMGMDVLTPSRGVSTRSMTRSMNYRNNQDENPSFSGPMKKGISDMSSSSKVTGKQCRGVGQPRKQCQGIVTEIIASAMYHETILSGEDKEVKKTLSFSSRRSSMRLKNLKK